MVGNDVKQKYTIVSFTITYSTYTLHKTKKILMKKVLKMTNSVSN